MTTVYEKITKAMAEATYCARCEQDFENEADKVAPDESEVFWAGTADVICQACMDAAVDSYLDNYNS